MIKDKVTGIQDGVYIVTLSFQVFEAKLEGVFSLDPIQTFADVKVILSAVADPAIPSVGSISLSGDTDVREDPVLVHTVQSDLTRPSKQLRSCVSSKAPSIEAKGSVVDQIGSKKRVHTEAKNPNGICAWDGATKHPWIRGDARCNQRRPDKRSKDLLIVGERVIQFCSPLVDGFTSAA